METTQFDSLLPQLTPILQKIELRRKELKRKGHKRGMLISGIVSALAIIASFFISFQGNALYICAAILVVVVVVINLISVQLQTGQVSSYYKEEVIAKVIRAFCPNASYSPYDGISEHTFCNSGLFQDPDRYHSEDLIEGRMDKTEFSCSEVHAEDKRTDSKGRTRWVTIFKGIFFIADFHKDFRGHTTVQRNSWVKWDASGSRVKLEDPAFEKTFDVFSTDQVEARYLLTPAMMERLLALEANLKSGISISFLHSTILIAIPNSKNNFEASIWTPITSLHRLKSDFAIIHALISIVEDLNLNTRIWTKE